MNAVAALLDQSEDLVNPSLATVIQFARRARAKAADENGEDQCAERRRERIVEGAIDEDVIRRRLNEGLSGILCGRPVTVIR